ncbi:MAG TPA: aminoglycoside phosphotransferase family protein [Streptosporangiaceae bacterium]|nr:aminoglycoside phosphotransferase family protein [Streptosporangiaceae bacterium]
MKDQPEGLTERELRLALEQGWDLRPDELRYAPVGAGSYHWTARDGRKARWFVAVDDLDGKPWLGDTREDVYAGLGVALDTARWLRDQAGLGFVAAPEPARDGATARRLSPRYAVALYRYIEGRNWEFGQHLPPEARDQLIDRLAALHQVTPPPLVPMARPHLSERDRLEQALGDLGRPWSGGPFSEPARALLAGAAGPTGDLLTSFDRLAGRLAAASGPVITHGEPHPGNVIQTGDGLRLIDWDTVGLAHPERDLWHVLNSNDSHAARRYTRATGHPIDPGALRCYRLRWALDDLAAFTGERRAGHQDTADTRAAWQALNDTVADVIRLART